MSVQIPLYGRRGLIGYALVDDADEALVAPYRWRVNDGYAVSVTPRPDGRPTQLRMHRLLLGLVFGDPRHGDHITRDRLDNRRSNLRIVTAKENTQNRGSSPAASSPYRGVSLHKRTGRWQAAVCINRRTHYLGIFFDELDAARTAARFRAQHFTHTIEDPALVGEVA